MKYISHRGNLNGKIVERENHPDYILEAIDKGFDVEIDVWSVDGKYFLGHDKPEIEINIRFLLDNYKSLWCHAKNLEALFELTQSPLINCFWHQSDDYTLTSHGYIWTQPSKPIKESAYNQIVLLFDWSYIDTIIPHGGICSDNIEKYRIKYENLGNL